MVDNLTTTLLQQHKPLHDPLSHFTQNFVSSKEPLPYDPMLGWYTAATLSGLLLLFIACVGIEKIKDNIVTFFENRHLKRDNSIPEDSLEERAQMTLMMQEPSPCVPLQINSMPALPHQSTNYTNIKNSNKSLNNFTTNHESSKSTNDSNYTSLQITSNTCLSQKMTKHAAIKSSSQELYTNPDNFTLEAAIQIPQTITTSPPSKNPKQICVITDTNKNQKSKQNSTSNSIIQHFSFSSLPPPASPLLTDLLNSFSALHKKSPSSPSLPCFPTSKPFNANTPKYSPIKPISREPCSKTSPLLDI